MLRLRAEKELDWQRRKVLAKFLAFLETSGNQRYLYATNRLRQNIGASQLTYEFGTLEVLRALGEKDREPPSEFRKFVHDHAVKDGVYEIIIAASGKALVLFNEHARAQEFVEHITRRALTRAPGLDLTGVIVPVKDSRDKDVMHDAIEHAHIEMGKMQSRKRSPSARFRALPIALPCASSEMPASDLVRVGQAYQPFSRLCSSKHGHFGPWKRRVPWMHSDKAVTTSSHCESHAASAQDHDGREESPTVEQELDNVEKIYAELDWLAVVHADGNGLGQVFKNFKDHVHEEENYLEMYRNFSLAIDEAAEAALRSAISSLLHNAPQATGRNEGIEQVDTTRLAPVVPVVVGGDDLSVICNGRNAVAFARDYLMAFERETAMSRTCGGDVIARIAQRALDMGGCPGFLAGGAGVAIVKPHFPFHRAYKLAEALASSAKNSVKRNIRQNETSPFPCSALDFQVVFSSSLPDPKGMRKAAILQEQDGVSKSNLHGGPYVISEYAQKTGDELVVAGYPTDLNLDWLAARSVNRLIGKIKRLRTQGASAEASSGQKPEGLSGSQIGSLRAALELGREEADAAVAGMRGTSKAIASSVNESANSLFRESPDKGRGEWETRVLDAITIAEFWPTAGDAK